MKDRVTERLLVRKSGDAGTQRVSPVRNRARHVSLSALTALIVSLGAPSAFAATFDGNARVEIADSTGALSWVATNNALTVSCWFKLAIPSDFTLIEDMAILVNRRSGSTNDAHAYAIYLSASTGNIEFSSKGGAAEPPKKLLDRPYLDRWYHVAVVRSGTSFKAYVDGREVLNTTTSVGDSRSTDGVSIGGWGNAKYLRGEVQEVSIYQAAVSQEFITQYLFEDLPTASLPALKGYCKLAYSATPSDRLKNFAQSPPPGTDPATTQGSGSVGFEETDREGEQSVFDSNRNGGRDAVTPLSGGFSWEQTAISRATVGVPFDFRIGYNSGNAFNGNTVGSFDPFADSVLGSGWRHTFDVRVIPSNYFSPVGGTDVVGLMLWDGSLEVWADTTVTGVYRTRHKEYRGELTFPNPSVCEWITPDRLIYKFQSPFSGTLLMRGRLLQIRDFNGNAINLSWDTILGRITKVTDTGAGEWNFTYLPSGRLDRVSGLGWTVAFTYDASNRLATKSLAGPPAYATVPSTQWLFSYSTNSPGLLQRVADPMGANDIRVAYDKFARKTSETDALGRITTFQYNIPALREITSTEQFGGSPDAVKDRTTVETFDRKLHLTRRRDPLGNTTRFEYDNAGNVILSTDARGNRTAMSYDARSNILSSTNALGEVTRWEYSHVLNGGTPHNKPTKEINPLGWENRYTYDSAGNLLKHADDIGTLAEHAYDARGLVTSSKDGNGNETRFGYDSTTGFPTSRTTAYGTAQAATWQFARTELGWLLSETNPLNETTANAYNVYGQIVTVTDPIGRVFTRTYDSNGNLLSESDGDGALTRYEYDAANERTKRTDRMNNAWDFTYTPFGELATTTGPAAVSDGVSLRDTVTRTYDLNGRVIKETDPYSDFASYEYDANGNQTVSLDKLGRRWKMTFDSLNRVIAERDPEGNIRCTTFDAAGRVKTVTSPNGFPAMHEHDGRGRLLKWTDPGGFEWIYTYDAVGNILDIEDALHGHYVMTYGPRNERLSEQNQDEKSWSYTYDPLVRLKTQSDPNGTQRTLTYDSAGRLESVELNSGRINSLGYDNNNNVVSLMRTKPGAPNTALYLDYDALDRLIESRDTFSKTVRYTYDALGRVATKVYPGAKTLTQGYDRLGRATSLSFVLSATQTFVCGFTYDKAGRLTGRTYPNGITQTNAFDTAGRITSLGYAGTASPPIALTYAYDRNGNKTGGNEQGTLAWEDASLADYDDTSRFKPDGKLIDRTDADAAGGPRTFAYTYDASGNMTLASAPDESYALAYDEDNRTTAITWDSGVTEKQIVNRYDARGRRVSSALDGAETRYVLDLAGGMERVLCDIDAAGAIRAWYIHGPDLSFRISAAGTLTCYHADAMGNVVRTTIAAGITRNQYAYTPYGRVIPVAGSTSDADDPYRFVGCQGVMEELPNLYFMRARYYSTEAGRFFSTDPIVSVGSCWTSRMHEYCDGNPLSKSDPDGNQALAIQAFVGGYMKGLAEAFANDVAKTIVTEAAVESGANRERVEQAVETADSIIGTVGAISDAYDVIISANAGYIPISEGGEATAKLVYKGASAFRDYVNNSVWNPLGDRLRESAIGAAMREAIGGGASNCKSASANARNGRSTQLVGAQAAAAKGQNSGLAAVPQVTTAVLASETANRISTQPASPTTSTSINVNSPKTQRALNQISKTLAKISELVKRVEREQKAERKKTSAKSKKR